jgi:excisionase family DNA binding protein
MPATKKKPAKAKPALNGKLPPAPAAVTDVLTLAEAAAYLKVAEPEVARLAQSRELPARMVGTEWRFLKSAIQTWLSTPCSSETEGGVWAMAGSWKDDPYLEEMLKEIHRNRGRTVDGEE